MLVVNAGTVEKDRMWIESRISPSVRFSASFSDESEKTAKLDLQGPSSAQVLSRLVDRAVVNGIKRYYFTYTNIAGIKVLLSRTGYTGELGYELFFPVEHAERIWDMLLEFDDVKPVGLGARDTLRLEKGYSLYGNDIDEERTPFEANLAKFVYMEKDFIGREALLSRGTETDDRLLTGFICEGRRSARSHFKVLLDGREIGEVTSGAFSPCLKKGIGLCYMEKALVTGGREIALTDIEGRTEIGAVVKGIPLYNS